ncbi:FG-GAP-like repeat-containing protein [Streptomyces vilmorinianum]|uniref:FG-GAP-like repeat-containing protein n=1 Tax=Streptomyces vilmorinianum TaxID=3051092 RepID=UPI0010FB5577|nr:FG-GAP-like repeat-containing protein [Streptomyces vilmorinianum]
MRRPRARTAVLAVALLASGVGAAGTTPSLAAPGAPVVGIDQLDVTPNWRAVPRHETVTAVGPTGYVHETEDSARTTGGELWWTDFTDPSKSVPLGYGVGRPFAESGIGGRYLYVQRELGAYVVRDLETGTERAVDTPPTASYWGLLGDKLLFEQRASEEFGTSAGYYLRRAADPTGASIPVTGWPADANVPAARLVAGDATVAVIRFGRSSDPYDVTYSDLGLVDLSTGRMTVVPATTPSGSGLAAPVAVSPDRLAWIDAGRRVHVRQRADLAGAEQTFVLPEGLSTARIGIVGAWVLAFGEATGEDAALRRRLVALHPDGRSQTLLEKAEGEISQVGGGGAAVVGGSSATDWAVLKAVPGKEGGAPVLEKLRRVEPMPATVHSIALGAGRLSSLEGGGPQGTGFHGRTLPVGPLHTGDPQPVWAGAEPKRLERTTPLFDSGDGRTVYLAHDDFKPLEVVARTSSGQVSRALTADQHGKLADAFGRWAVFQGDGGETLVVDLDAAAGTPAVVRKQPKAAAALWGDTLFTGTSTNGEVARVDLATGRDLGKVTTGAGCPATELQAAAGRWLYWTCGQISQQGVVDLKTGARISLGSGTAAGGLLGDGYYVARDPGGSFRLRVTDFRTGQAQTRFLDDSATAVVVGARREAWTVDRFGGPVAYRDGDNRVHVVWPGVPTSDLTAAATNAPAAMRVGDGWKASWSLSKPASMWQLTVRRKATGAEIRTYGGGEARSRIAAAWDGRTATGKIVPNGTYTWTLSANTADGQGQDLAVSGAIEVSGGVPEWRDLAGNDGLGDLLVMDTAGLVSMYRGTGAGGVSARIAGTGAAFPTSSVLVPFGDVNGDGCADVLIRVGDQLRAYRPGCGKVVSASSPYTLIGAGWGQYDVLTSPGDVNGDGFTDLIARQASTGDMYFYAGTADHRVKSRVRIGTNWKLYKKIVGAGDLNRDGRGDLLGVDGSGVLWRYYGTATGGVSPRVKVGGGWGVYSSLVGVGDLSSDGRADLVARDTSGRLWGYSGTGTGLYGTRVLIGTAGWNAFKGLY